MALIPGSNEAYRHANANLSLKYAELCCSKGPTAGKDEELKWMDCHGRSQWRYSQVTDRYVDVLVF